MTKYEYWPFGAVSTFTGYSGDLNLVHGSTGSPRTAAYDRLTTNVLLTWPYLELFVRIAFIRLPFVLSLSKDDGLNFKKTVNCHKIRMRLQ
jgi:hypothetical protein